MLARLFTRLARYKPTLVGTFPLGLQVAGSDLDVICEAFELDAFEAALAELGLRGHRAGDAIVTSFESDGMPVEVFAQARPIAQQLGFRHMIIEGRLLTLLPWLRDEVLARKRAGIKTEPAFAQVLELAGDPYQVLLELEPLSDAELRARLPAR